MISVSKSNYIRFHFMKVTKNNHKRIQDTILIMDYNSVHLEEIEVYDIKKCLQYRDTSTVTWLNIENVPPSDFVNELSLDFDLHPVILQDILTSDNRPKIEVMDDYIYIVLKMLYNSSDKKHILKEQVSIIISDKFIISTQQGIEGDVFDSVRQTIRRNKSTTRNSGTDYLFYKLLDAIIQAYFQVLEVNGEKMEELEEAMFNNPDVNTLNSLYILKRSILDMRKAVWPLREVLSNLERSESNIIKKSTNIYIRDLYERVIEVLDTIEIHRENLTGLLDLYLSSTSNKMNSVMKVLTMIATIFMPLSFVASVYGMNFRYMPGLENHAGFFIVIVIMILIFTAMMMFFINKKWL